MERDNEARQKTMLGWFRRREARRAKMIDRVPDLTSPFRIRSISPRRTPKTDI